jgi:hypothetical protein
VSGGTHERRDVQWQPVVIAGSLLGAMTVLALLATAGFLAHLGDNPAGWPGEPSAGVQDPRLETVPGRELAAYLERQSEELNSYGWVDRSGGVVRIPVERAIDVIAVRGLPETSGQFTRLDMVRRKAQEAGRNR